MKEPSTLLRFLCTFLDIDMNVSLLVKPIIPRLPRLPWIRQSNVEVMHDLRDQLIDLAQRYLPQHMSDISQGRRFAEALTFLPMQV